jgi:site-specific DNA-methyltransferase (adenine-specific)
MDCLEAMKQMPDKYFELAIVDPPYGINADNMTMGKGQNKQWTKGKSWDAKPPKEEYFAELFRVSEKQIIWGGNYFNLPQVKGWIVWDKGLYGKTSFADGELAWTNFNFNLRIAQVRYDGFLGADKDGRIHPTQKPIKLYKWLLKNYAKLGDKILDTHVGSASSLIACYDMGFDFMGFEIDKEYYNSAQERIENYQTQIRLPI